MTMIYVEIFLKYFYAMVLTILTLYFARSSFCVIRYCIRRNGEKFFVSRNVPFLIIVSGITLALGLTMTAHSFVIHPGLSFLFIVFEFLFYGFIEQCYLVPVKLLMLRQPLG